MKLDVIIDDKTLPLEIPGSMLDEAEEFFQKMDRDMDHGWQMGPEFIEKPDATQRCQIAANKLLTSVSTQNTLMMQLMAGYILKRMPGVRAVNIDTGGEMLGTELLFDDNRRPRPEQAVAGAPQPRPDTGAAGHRAEQDVSPVYKVGKSWRYAIFDRHTGQWVESPLVESEAQAQKLRDAACLRLGETLPEG